MYTINDAFQLLHKIAEFNRLTTEKMTRNELTTQDYRDYNLLYSEMESFCDKIERYFEDIESEEV